MFFVELTKTIIVPIEASDVNTAIELAIDDEEGFDRAWDKATPVATIIGEGD